MKPLLINTYDLTGGAARAVFRLHRGLRGLGIESRMLVQSKRSTDPTVIGPGSAVGKAVARLRPFLDSLPVRFNPGVRGQPFSPGLLPERLARRVAALGPDLIHLNWVAGGFLTPGSLRRFGRPLLWTLHDSWAFTGGCHLPRDCVRYRDSCGSCPVLGSTGDRDLSRRIWLGKRAAWQDLDITIVTPGRWLGECARSSSLFERARFEIIPNGLDLVRFRPSDQGHARQSWNLPQEKKLLLFGGVNGLVDRNKGFHLLLQAISRLRDMGWGERLELVIFGSSPGARPPEPGIGVRCLGHITDEAAMARLYAAADLLVAPSIQENLPSTVMEAMACGTPAAAFEVGGMPDLIEHRRTGYLAQPFASDDLASGIVWALEDEGRRRSLSVESRRLAESRFAIERVARRYADLYEELLRD